MVVQVLEDRGEMGSRHGRATFSVLLFQDLAVVVLLMLIPLLAPDPSGASSGGMAKIAQALGLAAVKAVLCIAGITAGEVLHGHAPGEHVVPGRPHQPHYPQWSHTLIIMMAVVQHASQCLHGLCKSAGACL